MTDCWVDLQLVTTSADAVAEQAKITLWTEKTFAAINRRFIPLTVRVVDEEEIKQLNNQYRNKDYSTNVLAFPFATIEGIEESYLGDVVICYPVVKNQAKQKDISVTLHFARMLIHGIMHLCGYDHQTNEEAQQMEQIEQKILSQLFST